MARIPDELIERIRDTADLLEIVQESIQLKRTGSDYRGPCPFHGGTHANFSVVPKKNMYHCFVCHASGDVFTWYRERFGMDYPSAVREVARRYGVVIPESSERVGPDPHEPLHQACDVAQGWFASQLRDSPGAGRARSYLADRQFDQAMAAEIGLGYAPKGPDFLAAMKALGISEEALLETALVRRREDGTLYSYFRDRLLFPIHDLRGRAVGFGGRILGDGEPKYLNTPETPIFHKGEQLYHIHLARTAIRKAGHAILVEGYFDVQRLVHAGIDQVVAPLGTGLTDAQALLIKRYAPEVILLYDSDGAGLKATFRAADILLTHGLRVRVATMPEGEDPDTVVQRGGAAAIQPLLHDAIDVLERKLQLLELKGYFRDAGRSRAALDKLLPTLRAPSDSLTRELYQTRVAEQLHIPRDAIAAEVASPPYPTAARAPTAVPAAVPPVRPRGSGMRAPRGSGPGAEIERKLLRILIGRPEWLARARGEISPDHFQVPTFREIFDALAALPDDAPVGDGLVALSERAREAWTGLVEHGLPTDGFDADREYAGALEALEEIHLFPEIAADTDPMERRRRWQALSREGQKRFQSYLNARRGRANLSPPVSPQEY